MLVLNEFYTPVKYFGKMLIAPVSIQEWAGLQKLATSIVVSSLILPSGARRTGEEGKGRKGTPLSKGSPEKLPKKQIEGPKHPCWLL